MNQWQADLQLALQDFMAVAKLAGDPVQPSDFKIEYLPSPHKTSGLPAGKMAIYAFWWDGVWLKVGQVGPNSDARYRSQHYTGSALSTLCGSLLNDPQMSTITGFGLPSPAAWIKASTCRANILLSSQRSRALLSLLEAFLHVPLRHDMSVRQPNRASRDVL
jgi:hypothetical protein